MAREKKPVHKMTEGKLQQVNSSYGSMEIEVPQDRKSTFEPQVVKKRQICKRHDHQTDLGYARRYLWV